ncbi:Lipolytic enzyme [Mycena kentingensis (nom. inval.)]|nr:Lipolytic enzyme [Mycena kentingensis (nom. inval.)]
MSPRLLLAVSILGSLVVAQQVEWGQCGGQNWTGPTTCVAGTLCVAQNPFYSQCIPSANAPPPTKSVTTTASRTSPTTSASRTTTTSPATNPTGVTGLTIRLLPLGDSIAWGFVSTDGNGYRNTLHNLLAPGNTVDFIGSFKSGTMSDNDNEGHIGAIIDQIAAAATSPLALPARPNIVLLMAGTNDILNNITLSTAPTRLSALIDNIFRTCPDAAVLVATLTPLTSSTALQTAVNTYNAAITAMVGSRAAAGQHVVKDRTTFGSSNRAKRFG